MVSAASGPSMSPLRLNATATSPSRPAPATASRARRTPLRARSIQCTGRDEPQILGRSVTQRGRQPPGVGRQHVAARVRVAAVHGAHLVRRVEDRAQAPEMLLQLGAVADDLDQLRAGRAVENDTAVGCDEVHDPGVGGARCLTGVSGLRDDGF